MSSSPDLPEANSEAQLDTFPKLLLNHARVRGDKIAMREKDLGIWQAWTWREVLDEVRAMACGWLPWDFKGATSWPSSVTTAPACTWE